MSKTPRMKMRITSSLLSPRLLKYIPIMEGTRATRTIQKPAAGGLPLFTGSCVWGMLWLIHKLHKHTEVCRPPLPREHTRTHRLFRAETSSPVTKNGTTIKRGPHRRRPSARALNQPPDRICPFGRRSKSPGTLLKNYHDARPLENDRETYLLLPKIGHTQI